MDFIKIFEKKIDIDNDLSNRYIDLDPNGYFIIKIDLETKKIILEHYLNTCLLYTSPSPRDRG